MSSLPPRPAGTGRAIRVVGDRVYRPAGWWTPTVHALLEHLHAVGFDRVPRPLGVVGDEEVLAWIPGESGGQGWRRAAAEAGLVGLAALLRDYHAATAEFVPPAGAVWALTDRGPEPGDVICHGDLGPWNVVWQGLTPVGLVDFDFAQPGPPMDDIAYALEYLAPFRDDAQALRSQGFQAAPDRARRLGLFARAYGLDGVEGLVDAVIRRQRRTAGDVRALAERGVEPQRAWVRQGYLDVLADRVRWSQENASLFG